MSDHFPVTGRSTTTKLGLQRVRHTYEIGPNLSTVLIMLLAFAAIAAIAIF